MISQISDINSEEESFHSNPSSSSLNSTIASNIRTPRTAATATAAAYTKKLVPMSRAWVSGRESLSACTSSLCVVFVSCRAFCLHNGLDYEIEIVDNDNNYEDSSYDLNSFYYK